MLKKNIIESKNNNINHKYYKNDKTSKDLLKYI